tara:strand:- start:781 stop:1248 length:468 start_codon:yes stop_codon:yes gene_type:complete
MPPKKKQEPKKDKLEFEMKIYSTPFTNSKNHNIGKVTHNLKGTMPYNSSDSVDHFLYNLYKFATVESLKFSEKDQKKLEAMNKEFNKEYFPHYKKVFQFYPIQQDIVDIDYSNNDLESVIDKKNLYLYKGGQSTKKNKKKMRKTVKKYSGKKYKK